VISTPEAIGAGSVIPAALEAEEHLEHNEPIVPVPPPREVSTLLTSTRHNFAAAAARWSIVT